MNLLSFDIEEWFLGRDASRIPVSKWDELSPRVEKSTDIILQILAEHNQKASFYILGWIAERYPQLIEKIDAGGHPIGYHSWAHMVPAKQGIQEFEKDLRKGIRLLESITKKPVTSYRAPMFSFHGRVSHFYDVLIDQGITSSSSILAGIDTDIGQIPSHPFWIERRDHKLLEFPLIRRKMGWLNLTYSGSGYMRVLPYFVSKHFFGRSTYNLAYFHPRDFDIDVPQHPDLGMIRNLYNSMGNSSTRNKLEHLLQDFDFFTLHDALLSYNNS